MGMTADISALILSSIGLPWIDPAVDNVNGNLFQQFLPPSSPARVCCIYERTGAPPQRGLGGAISWYNPRLIIMNRADAMVPGGQGYVTAQNDAFAIHDLLKTVVNQTLSGTYYLEILPEGSPEPQSLDPANRPVFITNFKVMKRT